MSDHIPFEIQSEIIKNLPVKSLLQFRCVSKQWKSLIDCSEFINNYHINRTNPQHRLLVEHKLGDVRTYSSIIDDNSFPQQKFPLTAPESLNFLRDKITLGSANGLLCFCGDLDLKTTKMAVIWNPSIRKCISIVIPNVFTFPTGYTVIGFGVCPNTSDPKLVKINVNKTKKPNTWLVEVFTLSTRVWQTVYRGALFKSCNFMWNHVCVDGIIYWRTAGFDEGLWSNFIVSFDLKREKFGEVSLSQRLASIDNLVVTKVNESLGLLECYFEGEIWVCGVWTKKDGVNKPFTKIYTVKVEGKSLLNRASGFRKSVLGFRNNGDVVLEIEDDNEKRYAVQVYKPSSGHINCVGINDKYVGFSAVSYMETLLLLHESNSIIR